MFKHIVEGWSQENYEEAIHDAMRKAALFVTDTKNVHISIKQLDHSEERGYHAVLELSKEQIALRNDYDMEDDPAHRAKLQFNKQFYILRRKEREHMAHAIAAHFEKIGKIPPPEYVPDFIIGSMTDVSIENDEVERDLEYATHLKPVVYSDTHPQASPELHSKKPEPEPK